MEQSVTEYLSHLNIPISESYCKRCILSHPDYPSLLSIADTLERLGIDYELGELKKPDVEELLFPCIIHHDKQGGQFLLLKEKADLETHKPDLKHWDGIVLKIEPADMITDPKHNEQYEREKRQKKITFTLLLSLSGFFLIPVMHAASWVFYFLFATAVGGALIGYLLLAKELGVTFKPVETFCNAGKRTNCDRILNAKDARLFGFITFTDAAASYFAFQLIILGLFIPLFEGTASFLSILAAASVLTIPVMGYSLYYQAVKANIWYRLCVIIDVILAMQVGLFMLLYLNGMLAVTGIGYLPIVISVLLFTIITASLLLVKDRLKDANELSRAETEAKRVKHDPEVFAQLLLKQEKADTTPFSPEVTIGDPNAHVSIMMVANLHCNPCRKAFDTIKQIISTYPSKVHFSVRFTEGMDNTIGELSASTYLIRYWQHFIQGHRNEGEQTQQLISDWYDEMDPKAFLKKYPARDELNTNSSITVENQHYKWVKQQDIVTTPTFFINGYEMPQHYRSKDLMPIVPGLAAVWRRKAKITKEFA